MFVVNQGRMHWLNIAVMIVLVMVSVMFALSNMEPTSISFLDISSKPWPLYVPIFMAFLLGFSGGMLSLSFSRRKHKQEIAELRHENTFLQAEVENLRNIPLQDDV